MAAPRAVLLFLGVMSTRTAALSCPDGSMTVVDSFSGSDGTLWTACEDLTKPGGAMALVSATQPTQWFEKGHSVYGSAQDSDYYLGLTKAAAVGNRSDVLGLKLLNSTITWQGVASAVPPIRKTGVRTFVGSRASAVDTTFNDAGEDAAGYG